MASDVVVGFIGLGTMGGKMATNILKAGYKVVVHDLHRQSAGHHLQAGAEWADTPRALGREVPRDLYLAARCGEPVQFRVRVRMFGGKSQPASPPLGARGLYTISE